MFDFARDIGRKLFSTEAEAEASEKIREEIERDNPGINGLQVNYEDGVVWLSSEASTAAAMEKAVLLAGNVKGVAEVKVDRLTAPPQMVKVEFYIIQNGDTLSGIAKRLYGDASAYPRLFDANREVIKDPDLIFPGQKIRVPLDAD